MIELSNPLTPDGGDIEQVETENLKNNAMFVDPSNGVGFWRKSTSDWMFITGDGIQAIEILKSNSDVMYDGLQWYLPLNVDAVFYCENNLKSYNGQLDKTFFPFRYYADFSADTVTQSIKIYAKLL